MMNELAKSNLKMKELCVKLFGKKKNYYKFLPIIDGKNHHLLNDEQRQILKEVNLEDFNYWKGCYNQIFEENNKFVKKMSYDFIKKMKIPKNMVDDFLSEANIAFMLAVRLYSNSEYCFRTYLGKAIWNCLSKLMANSLFKGGNLRRLKKYHNVKEMLEVSGQKCSFEDVCDYLGWGKVLRNNMRRVVAQRTVKSLEDQNMVEDCRKSSFYLLERKELLNAISSVEMTVLEADSFKSKVSELFIDSKESLKDVAKKHGVTPQAVGQAYMRARKKLAAIIEE